MYNVYCLLCVYVCMYIYIYICICVYDIISYMNMNMGVVLLDHVGELVESLGPKSVVFLVYVFDLLCFMSCACAVYCG